MRIFISVMLIGIAATQAAGAADEYFQRARARCRMAAAMHVDFFEDPARWTTVYRNCLRAGGWR